MSLDGAAKAFISGSALSSAVISLLYVGHAFEKAGRPSEVPMEKLAIGIPLVLGCFSVLNWTVVSRYGDNWSLLVGALAGLVMSMAGRFGLDLPQRIFGMSSTDAWRVHLISPVMYALIFRFIITPTTHFVQCKASWTA